MNFLDSVAQFVYPPKLEQDTEEQRLNRAILVVMATTTSMGGIVWGIVYLLLGVPEVSIWPFGYVVLSFINLLIYLRTKHFQTLLFGQLTFILLVPTFLMWHIGGFAASGAVMLWAFLCPIVALVVSERRQSARIWAFVFVGLVVFSGLIESSVAQNDVGMPDFGKNAFFIMNFLAPLITTYFIAYYFIGEGRRASAVMMAQSEELAQANESLTELTENLEEQVKVRTVELREALGNLSAVINSLVDGLVVTDMAGKITHFNPTLARMCGLVPEAVLGQDYHDVLAPELIEIIDQAIVAPNSAFASEVSLKHERIGNAAATAILLNENTGQANADAREVPIGTVTLIRDITREKEVDEMKTNFISTVSHELRTPLTSVLGFAKIIQKRLDESIFPNVQSEDKKVNRAVGQVGKNLEIIISESERLTELINNVLDIAKMEAGRIEWNMSDVSVSSLMERAVAATSSLFENKDGVELITDVDEEVPTITADSDRILQVMINLISNAVKFTDEGNIKCAVREENGAVVVAVTDTGVGIAPEDQEAVFDRFKQVGDTMTDKPQGTGLGLPICKQIVEHHGGRIWVESELGKGSTFAFAIHPNMALSESKASTREMAPIKLDELMSRLSNEVVVSARQVASQLDIQGKEILVVDDEANIRELLKQTLEAEGYRVRVAEDGVVAMKKVKEHRPDLIILDVMMPNINGFDVVAMLKSDMETMDVPVIILSIVEDRERGYRLGVDRYLTKPLNTSMLFHEVEVLLEQGATKRKVMIVDEDATTAETLAQLLVGRGYQVMQINDPQQLAEQAKESRPHMIVANSNDPEKQKLVQALRFEKGLEDIYILLYQA
jgi:PAS domain S-box-containing protein